jgi:hypothetical protein
MSDQALAPADHRPGPAPDVATEDGSGTAKSGDWMPIERIMSWLLRRGTAFYVVAALVLNIFKYGIGLYPTWRNELALARNFKDPLSAPLLKPLSDYRLDSPVSAVVAGLLHFTGARNFLGFHLFLACAAMVVPFFMPAVRRSPGLRALIGLLLVGSAIPAILLSWVGSYDPVSLGAAAVAGLAESPVTAVAAWFIFSFNNAPEAAVAVAMYGLVLWLAKGRPGLSRGLTYFGAVIAGYIGIRVVTGIWHGGESQATMMKFYGWRLYLHSASDYWPVIILSVLGAGWVFLVDRDIRVMVEAKWFFLGSVAVAVFLPVVILDESRLIAGMLWPGLLLVACLAAQRLSNEQLLAVLTRLAPVAVIMVIFLAWTDHVAYAGPRSIVHFIEYLLGDRRIPTPPS